MINRGTSCWGYDGTVGTVPNLLGLILGGERIIVGLLGSSLWIWKPGGLSIGGVSDCFYRLHRCITASKRDRQPSDRRYHLDKYCGGCWSSSVWTKLIARLIRVSADKPLAHARRLALAAPSCCLHVATCLYGFRKIRSKSATGTLVQMSHISTVVNMLASQCYRGLSQHVAPINAANGFAELKLIWWQKSFDRLFTGWVWTEPQDGRRR